MCIYSVILILCYTFPRTKTMCSCLIFNLELFVLNEPLCCLVFVQSLHKHFQKFGLLFSYIYDVFYSLRY